MAEPGGAELRLSPHWRRDELRRLRRLRRRFRSDPLLSPLPPVPSPARCPGLPSGAAGQRLLGAAAAQRGSAARTGTDEEALFLGEHQPLFPSSHKCPNLSFWRRIAGIAIAVAVIGLLTWITLHPPRLPHLEPCPDDWLYYKKKCYYHSGGAVGDWSSSQESCSDYGASLAVIDSPQELNFIMYRIRITDFWIGLRREGDKFFWVNGEPFDPNLFHVNVTNDGDCVHIDSAFVSTRRCSSHRNWLCTIGQFNLKTNT